MTGMAQAPSIVLLKQCSAIGENEAHNILFAGPLSQGHASASDSPRLSATQPSANDLPSDNEADYSREYDGDNTGSEGSWENKRDKKDGTAAEVTPEGETPGGSTPEAEEDDGMLPRDIQRKTAYYDYAAEQLMSQADAKLFYQRSQLDAVKGEESNYGSAYSPHGSPVLRARTYSNMAGMSIESDLRRSGSMKSMRSSQGHNQK